MNLRLIFESDTHGYNIDIQNSRFKIFKIGFYILISPLFNLILRRDVSLKIKCGELGASNSEILKYLEKSSNGQSS